MPLEIAWRAKCSTRAVGWWPLVWGILILVAGWVLGLKETRKHWQFCTTYASLPPTPWRPFGAYFGNFYAEGLQWLKRWGMIVQRLKFKTCKVLEVYWIFAGFNKFLWVLFFWVTLNREWWTRTTMRICFVNRSNDAFEIKSFAAPRLNETLWPSRLTFEFFQGKKDSFKKMKIASRGCFRQSSSVCGSSRGKSFTFCQWEEAPQHCWNIIKTCMLKVASLTLGETNNKTLVKISLWIFQPFEDRESHCSGFWGNFRP